MHEMSLMNSLMRQIERLAQENSARKVTRVRVKLGALTHFSKEHFREHFDEAAKEGIASGAKLDIELLTDTNDPNAQRIVIEDIDIEDES